MVLLSSRRTISGIGENGCAESGSRTFLYCWHIFFLDIKGDRDNNSPRGIRIKDVPLKSQEFIKKKKKVFVISMIFICNGTLEHWERENRSKEKKKKRRSSIQVHEKYFVLNLVWLLFRREGSPVRSCRTNVEWDEMRVIAISLIKYRGASFYQSLSQMTNPGRVFHKQNPSPLHDGFFFILSSFSSPSPLPSSKNDRLTTLSLPKISRL